MADNSEAARRLLLISSPSEMEDRDDPPTFENAEYGVLAAIRLLQDDGQWPDDLRLLVVSDSYGLVELPNPGKAPVPVPFTRTENPDWWAGFISRNLDNHISRRNYSQAFAMLNAEHELALQLSVELRNLDTVWASSYEQDSDEMAGWITDIGSAPVPAEIISPVSLDGKKTKGKKKSPTRAGGKRAAQPAEAEQPAPPAEEPAIPLPPSAAAVIEDSIYSDRFMLVLSKLSPEQIGEVRRQLDAAWATRSAHRHERRSVSNIVVKSAHLPWSERPSITLFERIFESIGMPSVLGSINKAVSQLSLVEPGRYRDIIARLPRDESAFMADLLHLIWEISSRMDKDEIAMLRAYLIDVAPHEELKRMSLPRNLRLEDRYEILHSVLSSLVGLTPGGSLSDYRRVWLFLDEIENLLGYKDYDRWELTKALFTLIGRNPKNFTIWLNITPGHWATFEKIQTALENILLITHDLTAEQA